MKAAWQILPVSEPWERWRAESGEQPPNFDALPSIPELPDPLVWQEEGQARRIRTPAEWGRQRERILALFHHWVFGTVPPPPGNVRAVVLDEHEEPGVTVRHVRLEFGPEHRAHLAAELILPRTPGPFPVFLTQHNHRHWALIAVSRGYVACAYAGADSADDTDQIAANYTGYDWSRLTRRAWAGSRCIDYLVTLPEVDRARIAIAGHSRNGKQSLIAAALDERISVVISSSSGAGGACSYRGFSEAQFGEGIELLTRVFPDWLHPRLRFFAGQEQKLPVDNHELIALAAPRACLISTALNDSVESTWDIQRVYQLARPVYQLLEHGERLGLIWRHGTHETRAADIERYLDWCDTHFGRHKYEFPVRLLHACNWDAWQNTSDEAIRPEQYPIRGLDDHLNGPDGAPLRTLEEWRFHRPELQKQISWALGEPPPSAASPAGSYGTAPAWANAMLGRGSAAEGLEKQSLVFGEYLNGDLYAPADWMGSAEKRPAILWLPPLSLSNGYGAGYRRGEQPYLSLARQGYVLFAFDPIGMGRRIEEGERFYERHPRWSLLGKMVHDARRAVDALGGLPFVDPARIFAVGFGLGGAVTLFLAALDERVAGAASVCGFTPLRLDIPDNGTGGLRRWSHDLALMPRLGFFLGHEGRLPFDFHEVLALIAPRPALVVSPQLDREATPADVRACVAAARPVYERYPAGERLTLEEPEDYNRFGPEMQALMHRWLATVTSREQ